MKAWLQKLINAAHEKGLPLPMIRNHGVGSVSLTLLWISSVFIILALLQIGKISFWESLAWHVTSAVLYYNRSAKISKDGIELSGETKE
jgi:hypothetical protein